MEQEPKVDPSSAEAPPAYEAPRVESVVTSDEVEREALYGGGISMK